MQASPRYAHFHTRAAAKTLVYDIGFAPLNHCSRSGPHTFGVHAGNALHLASRLPTQRSTRRQRQAATWWHGLAEFRAVGPLRSAVCDGWELKAFNSACESRLHSWDGGRLLGAQQQSPCYAQSKAGFEGAQVSPVAALIGSDPCLFLAQSARKTGPRSWMRLTYRLTCQAQEIAASQPLADTQQPQGIPLFPARLP